jgi:hypothetical protein
MINDIEEYDNIQSGVSASSSYTRRNIFHNSSETKKSPNQIPQIKDKDVKLKLLEMSAPKIGTDKSILKIQKFQNKLKKFTASVRNRINEG